VSQLLLLNGPNLNLLGSREPDRYGTRTLTDIETELSAEAQRLGHQLSCFQSNHEGVLVDRIHQAKSDGVSFILFNPGAYTHTSIALRDALLGVAIPFIEIHLSNVYAREAFRHRSYLSDIAAGVITGLGPPGYRLALQAAHEKLLSQSKPQP
jgi:3-dehydroquinate dehydratase-2